jgi:predicted enzyme related to lactoylglutathione lyase
MSDTTLSLMVLRSSNIETSMAFYRALNLDFQQEQHGSGPIHYSCQIGAAVMEIFPGEAGTAPDHKSGGATMLGFTVSSLDDTLEALLNINIAPLSPPKQSAWGRRAVVIDPDGRAVEISEAPIGTN